MNEQSRPSTGTAAGTGAGPAAGTASAGSTETAAKGSTAATAAVGPLTLRDLVILGSVAIIFVASVVPIIKTVLGNANLWNTAGLFFIGIGVILPLVVGGLFLARRMSPATKVRIGSLSVDQFASVVASFATFFFFSATVSNFSIAYLIGLIGALLLLVSTVCAQWIPAFAADFSGRTDVPAHVAARDAVPALKRPAAPKPVVAQTAAGQQGGVQQGGGQQLGQGAPSQGVPAQYVPGQQGAGQPGAGAQQGGWNAAPAATHTSAGQIFTPAKENSAGAGAGAEAVGGAAGTAAAGAVAAANPAASAATSSGSATPAIATSGHGSTQNPLADQSVTAANTAAHTAASGQASADNLEAARGESGKSKDAAATTLNPQVPEAAKTEAAKAEAVKPEAAAESPVAPAAARESITATVNPVAKPVVAEPFWFAVDRPQNVINEKTRQFAFKLAPGAWILALEDRGNSFLVQDSHGKTGVLLDLVGIERASDSQ
ncbi:hypothetical protein ACX80D_08870 [Arthrobacter sp. Sr24]